MTRGSLNTDSRRRRSNTNANHESTKVRKHEGGRNYEGRGKGFFTTFVFSYFRAFVIAFAFFGRAQTIIPASAIHPNSRSPSSPPSWRRVRSNPVTRLASRLQH